MHRKIKRTFVNLRGIFKRNAFHYLKKLILVIHLIKMQNTNRKIIIACLISFLWGLHLFSQTKSEIDYLIENTHVHQLNRLKQDLNKEQEQLQRFIRLNATQFPKYRINEDGSFDELVAVLSNRIPIYYAIDNIQAANSTRTNHLQSGGSLQLNVNGENMRAGVWDGGPVRSSHQEFQNRVSVGDGVTALNGNSFHMTHVTGTVGAGGIDPLAKGMAPQAEIVTYDWSQDAAEVIQEITTNGLLLSNHSYGVRASTAPSWFVGAYSNQARIWDEIMYNAPYYLMVTAAGNEGTYNNLDAFAPGLDKLTGNKNTKNNLVVANALAANVSPNGQLISVQINANSSQGPTDDRRIKPDITGNGTFIYSSLSQSNSSYGTLSGTSMASPNVMGSLILLQQYNNQLNHRFLRSATLKGLACHTADDAGAPGPDPVYGWGLLNARRAALTIQNNGLNTWISEETLMPNQTLSWDFLSDGISPLMATICWTDAPGQAVFNDLNNSSPVLINDLDLRIIGPNGTLLPWRISENNPAVADTGDNLVDPIERVQINMPTPGLYTIQVSHKGNLFDNKQDFSLIVTGVISNIAFTIQGLDDVICAGETITKNLVTRQNHNLPLSFSAVEFPEGVNVSFQNNNGQNSVHISQTDQLEPGNYLVKIQLTDGFETEIRSFSFRVYRTNFEPLTNIIPVNNSDNQTRTVALEWQGDENMERYTIQVSLNPSFENLVVNELSNETLFLLTGLESQTVYYWRVIPENRCAADQDVAIYSFKTGGFDCSIEVEATDFNDAFIGNFANAEATVPISVTEDFLVADVKVEVAIEHTWVQDMTLYLSSPSTQEIILLEEKCGSENDLAATFDDNGGSVICSQAPAISGIIAPEQSLANFSGQSSQGDWLFRVLDRHNGDGGEILNVKLLFCALSVNENELSLLHQSFVAPFNSTKTLTPEELLAELPFGNDTPVLYTLRSLPSKGMLLKNNLPLQIGSQWLQTEVESGALSYQNSLMTIETDSFEVDIEAQPGHWLPQQMVSIEINGSMSSEEHLFPQFTYYPNPSDGLLHLKMDAFVGEMQLQVFDVSGRLLNTWAITELASTIELSTFPAGIYVFELRKGVQKKSFKLIKN